MIYEKQGKEEWRFNEWESDESGKMDWMLVVADSERDGTVWVVMVVVAREGMLGDGMLKERRMQR